MSDPSAQTLASNVTAVSMHSPDEYEKISYYNGIAGDGDHPYLIYRSDLYETPFPKPTGRFGHIPIKSAHGVFDTPLNPVWDLVVPKFCELFKARQIAWVSIDPVRFLTHPMEGETKGNLGPPVIWIGVTPGSVSADTAYETSQELLTILHENGANGVIIEWREAVLQRLSGSPLMGHVDNSNATHHVRRFLTPLLGVPLAVEEMEEEDHQGTLTLWFHENKDEHGNPSKNVYGVSNCHALRKNPDDAYEHRSGAPKQHVRVCGMR